MFDTTRKPAGGVALAAAGVAHLELGELENLARRSLSSSSGAAQLVG